MSVSHCLHCLPARSWTSFIWTCQHLRTHLQGAVMRRKPSGRRSPMEFRVIGLALPFQRFCDRNLKNLF